MLRIVSVLSLHATTVNAFAIGSGALPTSLATHSVSMLASAPEPPAPEGFAWAADDDVIVSDKDAATESVSGVVVPATTTTSVEEPAMPIETAAPTLEERLAAYESTMVRPRTAFDQ